MLTEFPKVKKLAAKIGSQKKIIDTAYSLGCVNAKIILTRTISLGRWVKLHCQYGCQYYGTRYTCPPCTPNADEMSEILLDYQKALLIQAPEGKQVREIVVSLEDYLKKEGYYKAFGLCATPCDLCEVCTLDTQCKYPEKARPTLQACGIDVSQTMAINGWENVSPIEPCSDSHSIGLVLIH